MDQDGWWRNCSLVYVSGSGSCRTVVGFCWLSITMTEWVKICKTEGAQPVSIVCFLATCTWYGFHSFWFLFFFIFIIASSLLWLFNEHFNQYSILFGSCFVSSFLFLIGLRNVSGFVIFMKDISKDFQFFLY